VKSEGGRILIIDDDEAICDQIAFLLDREGYRTKTTYDGETALRMIGDSEFDLLLLDIKMPGMSGLEVLRQAKKYNRDLSVIMITGYAGVQGAVEAMKAGALDYLPKPFEHDEVVQLVRRTLRSRKLTYNDRQPAQAGAVCMSLADSMGPSNAVSRLISDVERVARSNFSVVIVGETGSGKELIARSIHQSSLRSKGPFVPLDCGAIPETLIESELFGYEKGAFTGASGSKQGQFEAAKKGTLFLDEISNMPFSSQAKLLRVLQEKSLYRVGSTASVRIDARLLAASNVDLRRAVQEETFRRDLYFRLNEFTIRIPPLRERKEDILYLAQRFMNSTNEELGKNVRAFTERAAESLIHYEWPGNVRQLRSTIRRAVLLAEDVIDWEHFDIQNLRDGPFCLPKTDSECNGTKRAKTSWSDLSLKEIVRQSTVAIEREVLVETLRKAGGNKAQAVRMLEIDYKTIHTKLKKYKISK